MASLLGHRWPITQTSLLGPMLTSVADHFRTSFSFTLLADTCQQRSIIEGIPSSACDRGICSQNAHLQPPFPRTLLRTGFIKHPMMAANSPFGYHFDMAARCGRLVGCMPHMRLAGSSYQCEDVAEDLASCHQATGAKKGRESGANLKLAAPWQTAERNTMMPLDSAGVADC